MNQRLFRGVLSIFCLTFTTSVSVAQNDPAPSSASPPTIVAQEESPKLKPLKIGSPAPPIDIKHWLSDDHGKHGSVNDLKPGNVYVIEFWATWCGPCIGSMPQINKRLQEP